MFICLFVVSWLLLVWFGWFGVLMLYNSVDCVNFNGLRFAAICLLDWLVAVWDCWFCLLFAHLRLPTLVCVCVCLSVVCLLFSLCLFIWLCCFCCCVMAVSVGCLNNLLLAWICFGTDCFGLFCLLGVYFDCCLYCLWLIICLLWVRYFD